VDGALVCAGSLWPTKLRYSVFFTFMDISIGKIIICMFGLNVLLRGNKDYNSILDLSHEVTLFA
jgi:hypothetical protein